MGTEIQHFSFSQVMPVLLVHRIHLEWQGSRRLLGHLGSSFTVWKATHKKAEGAFLGLKGRRPTAITNTEDDSSAQGSHEAWRVLHWRSVGSKMMNSPWLIGDWPELESWICHLPSYITIWVSLLISTMWVATVATFSGLLWGLNEMM